MHLDESCSCSTGPKTNGVHAIMEATDRILGTNVLASSMGNTFNKPNHPTDLCCIQPAKIADPLPHLTIH